MPIQQRTKIVFTYADSDDDEGVRHEQTEHHVAPPPDEADLQDPVEHFLMTGDGPEDKDEDADENIDDKNGVDRNEENAEDDDVLFIEDADHHKNPPKSAEIISWMRAAPSNNSTVVPLPQDNIRQNRLPLPPRGARHNMNHRNDKPVLSADNTVDDCLQQALLGQGLHDELAGDARPRPKRARLTEDAEQQQQHGQGHKNKKSSGGGAGVRLYDYAGVGSLFDGDDVYSRNFTQTTGTTGVRSTRAQHHHPSSTSAAAAAVAAGQIDSSDAEEADDDATANADGKAKYRAYLEDIRRAREAYSNVKEVDGYRFALDEKFFIDHESYATAFTRLRQLQQEQEGEAMALAAEERRQKREQQRVELCQASFIHGGLALDGGGGAVSVMHGGCINVVSSLNSEEERKAEREVYNALVGEEFAMNTNSRDNENKNDNDNDNDSAAKNPNNNYDDLDDLDDDEDDSDDDSDASDEMDDLVLVAAIERVRDACVEGLKEFDAAGTVPVPVVVVTNGSDGTTNNSDNVLEQVQNNDQEQTPNEASSSSASAGAPPVTDATGSRSEIALKQEMRAFIDKSGEVLTLMETEQITAWEGAERLRRDMTRLESMRKRSLKPPPAPPIIIDGVKMDL